MMYFHDRIDALLTEFAKRHPEIRAVYEGELSFLDRRVYFLVAVHDEPLDIGYIFGLEEKLAELNGCCPLVLLSLREHEAEEYQLKEYDFLERRIYSVDAVNGSLSGSQAPGGSGSGSQSRQCPCPSNVSSNPGPA